MKRFEGTFFGSKGAEIFYQTWQVTNPVGSILVTHGLSEHSECYHSFAQVMNKSNWDVIGWDLRGHGRSEGKRGYVENFDDYCKDLKLLTEHCVETGLFQSKIPRVLFAHSMGGLAAIKAIVLYGDMGYRALCLSAPLLGLSVEVPKLKEKVAQIAGKWLPRMTLYNEIHYEDLSRDEEIIKSYEKDPLRHDKISPHVFLGMVENMQLVTREAGKIQIPTLMQLSGQDRIVSSQDAEKFFKSLSTTRKKLHIYPDSYHEIFNDLDKSLAHQHLKEFLSGLV
jgi:alpha-beta hydrolase superfamily lysophospholipase